MDIGQREKISMASSPDLIINDQLYATNMLKSSTIAEKQQHNNTNKSKKLFPQKLWDLINDDKYSFCLRWSDDGQLVYLNRDDFEDSYLKTAENQFHTQKAISFVRQMNMYGFRKVDDCFYENDNFKRNCDHLLKNMIRKHPNKNPTTNGNNSTLDHHNLQQQAQFPSTYHHQQQISTGAASPPFYHQPSSLETSMAAAAVSLLAPVASANLIDLRQQQQQPRASYPFYNDCLQQQQLVQGFVANGGKAREAQRDNQFQNLIINDQDDDDIKFNEDSMSSSGDIDLTTTSAAPDSPVKEQFGQLQQQQQLENDNNLTAIYALLASINTDFYQQHLANIPALQQNLSSFNINRLPTEYHQYTQTHQPDHQATQNIPQLLQQTKRNAAEGQVTYSGSLISDKSVSPPSISLLARHNKSQVNNRGRHFKRKLRPLNLSLRRHD